MKNKSFWLVLSLIVIVIVVVMLVLTSQDSSTEQNVNGETKIYTGQEYLVRYPAAWVIDVSGGQENVVIFTSSDLRDEVIIFALTSAAEKDIRDAINITSEKTVSISGTTGTKITGENRESGEPAEIVFVQGKGSSLYALAGKGKSLEVFVDSFEILP